MSNFSIYKNAYEDGVSLMVEQYSGMLVGLCTRLLQDYYLAQDAVQETFLKAYLKRDSFRGEKTGSEKAWLISIAMNVCRDQQRSRWSRMIESRISVDTLSMVSADTAKDQVLLNAVIDSLPKKYRNVLYMYYYQDMTAQEIAYVVKKSTSVVYRRIREARQVLMELMENYAEE